ncbi:hypothetical protein G9A89_001166 [Geosiphon pyriformis]|nr:hypothetical protein G9A89_001166 [Geosiphon pyriformis]
METTASSSTSKKKAPKGAFYGPASGSFSQKKKVVIGNVKYSGNKRDISLSKSGSGDSIYSDVNSLSGDDEDIGMSDVNNGSFLGSAATTFKVIKTSVEMSVKKSFALDINLLAVKRKSAMAKIQLIRKIFSSINGFGETTTPSKFEEII